VPGRRLGALAGSIFAEYDLVENSTGDRPWACPWWSFYDRDVGAVLRAYDLFESGQLREMWGDDPPWWLVLGVQHYHRVLSAVRSESYRLAREAKGKTPPRPRLPPGFVVEHEGRG
jgi:hypothetical protein